MMMRNWTQWKKRLATFLAVMLLVENMAMPLSASASTGGETGIVEYGQTGEANTDSAGLTETEDGVEDSDQSESDENTVSEQPAGKEAAQEQATGEETADEQPAGEQVAGEETVQEQIDGEQAAGEQASDEQADSAQEQDLEGSEEQQTEESSEIQILSFTASATEAAVGDVVTFTAVVPDGMDPYSMTWQWQLSADGENWVDIDGAQSYEYTTEISVVHLLNQMRVVAQPLQVSGFSSRMRVVAQEATETYTSATFQLTAASAGSAIYWNPYGSPTFSEDGLIIVAAGNDSNDGSETAPVQSLSKAITLAGNDGTIICMNLYGVYENDAASNVTIELYSGDPNQDGTAHTGQIFSVVKGVLTLNNVELPETPVLELAGGTLVLEKDVSLADYIYISAPSQAILPIRAIVANTSNGGIYKINFDVEYDGVVGIATHVENVTDEELLARFELDESLQAKNWALYVLNGNVYAHIPPVYQAVYLDGVDGKDSNLGNEPTCPVRTFAQAKALLDLYDLDTIIVMDTVTLPSDGGTYALSSGQTVRRHSRCTGPMFEITEGDHTFSMAVDGRIASYNEDGTLSFADCSEPLVQISGGTLKLTNTSGLTNSTGDAITATGGTVEFDGATVSSNGILSGTATVTLNGATLNATGDYAISVSGNVTSSGTTYDKPIRLTGGDTASIVGGSVSSIESDNAHLTVEGVGDLTSIIGTGDVTVTSTAVKMTKLTGKEVTITSGTIGTITASSGVAVTNGTIDEITADGNVTIQAGEIGTLTAGGTVTVQSGKISTLTSEGNVAIATGTIGVLNTNGDVGITSGSITTLNLNGASSALITDGTATVTNVTLAGPNAMIKLSGALTSNVNLTIETGRNGRVVVKGENDYNANSSSSNITHVKEDGDSFTLVANDNDIVMDAPLGVYVSANGSDSNTGLSAETPVATYKKAVEVLNEQNSDFPRYIYVIGGISVTEEDDDVTPNKNNVTVMSYDGSSSPMITVPSGVTFAPTKVNFDGAGVDTIFDVAGVLALSSTKLSNADTGIRMADGSKVSISSSHIYADTTAIDMDAGTLTTTSSYLYGPTALDMLKGDATLTGGSTRNSAYGDGTVNMANGTLTTTATLNVLNQTKGTVTVNGGTISTHNMADGTTEIAGGTVYTLNKTKGDLTVSDTGKVSTLTHKAGKTVVSAGSSSSSSYGISYMTMETGELEISGRVYSLTMNNGTTRMIAGYVSSFTQKKGASEISGGSISTLSVTAGTSEISGGSISNLYIDGADGTATVTATDASIGVTRLSAAKSVLHTNGQTDLGRVYVNGTGAYLSLSGEITKNSSSDRIEISFSSSSSNYYEGYSVVKPESPLTDAVPELENFKMGTDIEKRFNLVPGSGDTATHIVLGFEGVFIDTQNGSDDATGHSPTDPVKTFAKAAEVLKAAVDADDEFVRAIYIVDKSSPTSATTAVVSSETVEFDSSLNAYITPHATTSSVMLEVPAGVTFGLKNVDLSGNGNNGKTTTNIVVSVSGTFTMTNGIIEDGRKTVMEVKSGANVTLNNADVVPHNNSTSSATTVSMTGGRLELLGGSEIRNGKYGVDKSGGDLVITNGKVSSASNTGVRNAGGSTTISASGSIYGAGEVGLDLTAGTATLDGGTIERNGYRSSYTNQIYTSSRGGVAISGGTFTMNSGTITNNRSAENGGGVAANRGTFIMKSGTVSSNYASTNGGGIYAASAATVTIAPDDGKTIAISSNKAINGSGGGIWIAKEDVTVSTLSSNTAGTNGGGAYLGDGTLTVTGNIYSNTAAQSGGGVYMAAGVLTTSGNVYSNTATSGNGGGVYMASGSYTPGGSVSYLRNNKAESGNGGAIYVATGTLTVSGITLGGSSSNPNTAINGGAVYAGDGAAVTVANASITDNTASADGAGIYLADGAALTASETSAFSNNTATQNGGGIYAASGSTLTIESATISGNKAVDGAGLYWYCGSGNIATATIQSNVASGNGGGMYIVGTAVGHTHVFDSNVTISGNTAVNGAGIYNNCAAVITVEGASITGNTATTTEEGVIPCGGGIYMAKGTLNVNSGSLNSNAATNGNGGAIYAAAGVTVNYSGGTSTGCSAANGSAIYLDATYSGATQTGYASLNHTAGTIGGDVYAAGKYTITLPAAATTGHIALIHRDNPLMISGESTSAGSNKFTIDLKIAIEFRNGIIVDGTADVHATTDQFTVTNVEEDDSFSVGTKGDDLVGNPSADVFWDPSKAQSSTTKDENDGSGVGNAVETFERAKELLAAKGPNARIVQISSCTTSGTYDGSITGTGTELAGVSWNAKIVRCSSENTYMTKWMFDTGSSSGSLTFTNITISGEFEREADEGVTYPDIKYGIVNSYTVTLNENTVLCNNHAPDNSVYAGNNLIMNGAEISNCTGEDGYAVVYGYSANVSNSKFSNLEVENSIDDIAPVIATSRSVTIQNSVVSNCDNGTYDGIIKTYGSVTVEDSRFIDNTDTVFVAETIPDVDAYKIMDSVFDGNAGVFSLGMSDSDGGCLEISGTTFTRTSGWLASDWYTTSSSTALKLKFDRCTFNANTSCLVWMDSMFLGTVELKDCTIGNPATTSHPSTTEKALGDGGNVYGSYGLVWLDSSCLVLDNTTIAGNYIVGDDSYVAVVNSPNITMTNSRIDRNYISGGTKVNAAVYNSSNTNTLKITGGSVSGNYTAVLSANAADNAALVSLTFDIDGTTISGNSADGIGILSVPGTRGITIKNAAVDGNGLNGLNSDYLQISLVEVENCSFDNNGKYGIYLSRLSGNERTKVTHTSISGNGQAGLYIETGTGSDPMVLENATVDGNGKTGGHGIYLGSYVIAELSDTMISNNGSLENTEYGGGIYVDSSATLELDSTVTFSGNMAQKGGALYVAEFDELVKTLAAGPTFSENEAIYGGALYLDMIYDTTLDGTGVKMLNNKATYGGAIAVRGGRYLSIYGYQPVVLTGFEMTGNEATLGGAIYAGGDQTTTYAKDEAEGPTSGTFYHIQLKDMTLSGNVATMGGAVYVNSATSVTLNRINLTENSAAYGGAIYADVLAIGSADYSDYGDELNVKYTTISGNISTDDDNASSGIYNAGRVLLMHGGTVDIEDCIYLADKTYPITLTNSMYRSDTYNIALNMGTGAFSYGDVVIEPNKNNAYPENAAQYLNNMAPVNSGVVFAKGSGDTEKSIVLKQCFFVDGVSGNNDNSGATPNEAFKTVKYALDYVKEKNLSNVVLYICGEIVVDENQEWTHSTGVELHRYTGFAIGGDKTYPAYYGDLIHVADGATLTIGSGISRIQGWHATGDTIVPKGDLILVDKNSTLNFTGTTELEGNMTETVDGGGIRNNGTVNVDSSAKLTILDVSGDNGGAINNAGTLNINGSLNIGNAKATNGGAIYNTGTVNVNGTLNTVVTTEDSSGNEIILTTSATSNGDAVWQGGEFIVNEGATLNLGEADIFLTNDKHLTVHSGATLYKPDIEIGDARDGRAYVHYTDRNATANDHNSFDLSNTVKNSFQLTNDGNDLKLILTNVVYVLPGYNGEIEAGKVEGMTPDNPFGSLEEAYEVLKDTGGMIYMVGGMTVDSSITISAKSYNTVTVGDVGISIRRYSQPDKSVLDATNINDFDTKTYEGPLFIVTSGTLTLDGILIDGHATAVTSAGEKTQFTIAGAVSASGPLVNVSGGALELKNGASLTNNTSSNGADAIYNNGTVTISGTTDNTVNGTVKLADGKIINVTGSELPSNAIQVLIDDAAEGRVIATYTATPGDSELGNYILEEAVLKQYKLAISGSSIILTAKGTAYVSDSGNDSLSSSTADAPFKTLAKAYQTLGTEGGTIYIVGTVTIASGTEMQLTSTSYISGSVEHSIYDGEVRIMRYSKPTATVSGFTTDSFTGTLLQVESGATLSLQDIELNGHSAANTGNEKTTAGAVEASAPIITNKGKLILEDGTELLNNKNVSTTIFGGAIRSVGSSSSLMAAGVTISGNASSYGSGIFFTGGSVQLEGKPSLASDQWVYPAQEANYLSVVGRGLDSSVVIPVSLPTQYYKNGHVIAKYETTLTPSVNHFTLENPQSIMETNSLSKAVKSQDVYLKQVFAINYPDPETTHLSKTDDSPTGTDPNTEVTTWIQVTDDNYILPTEITVTVTTPGGTVNTLNEGEHYTYDPDTGEIVIDEESVNGTISIEAQAVEKITITYPDMDEDHLGKADGMPDKAIPYDGDDVQENFETRIVPENGYSLPDEITIKVDIPDDQVPESPGSEYVQDGSNYWKILTEGEDYTYDPETGDIVIFEENLIGAVKIEGKGVEGFEAEYNITLTMDDVAGNNAISVDLINDDTKNVIKGTVTEDLIKNRDFTVTLPDSEETDIRFDSADNVEAVQTSAGYEYANSTIGLKINTTDVTQANATVSTGTSTSLILELYNANAITESTEKTFTLTLTSGKNKIYLNITLDLMASQINVTVPLVLVMKTDIDGGEATLADTEYKITNNSSMNVKLSGVAVQNVAPADGKPNPMEHITGSVAGLINKFSINFDSGYLGKVITAGGAYNPIVSVVTSALDFVTKNEQDYGVHIATILYTISIPE